MKKLLLLLLFCQLNLFGKTSSSNNSSSATKNYIVNLTGRTIILNFYAKNPLTGKSTFYDSKIFGPLLIAGKSPNNFTDTFTASLTPPQIDMHPNMCFKVTVDAFSINNDKLKDNKIKGTSMPTPAYSVIPNDFQISLDQDQLIITQLPTSKGINFGGNTKQWPSKEDLAIKKMTRADQIIALEEQNKGLQNQRDERTKEIQKMHDKNRNIKPGMLIKVNNRHKLIKNINEKIEKNNKTIAQLKDQELHDQDTKTT